MFELNDVRKAYSIDLTDKQFELIELLLPLANNQHGGHPQNSLTCLFSFPGAIFGDNKYHNKGLTSWLERERSHGNVEVKSRPKESKGFVSCFGITLSPKLCHLLRRMFN